VDAAAAGVVEAANPRYVSASHSATHSPRFQQLLLSYFMAKWPCVACLSVLTNDVAGANDIAVSSHMVLMSEDLVPLLSLQALDGAHGRGRGCGCARGQKAAKVGQLFVAAVSVLHLAVCS
jgi:hypothetical protein